MKIHLLLGVLLLAGCTQKAVIIKQSCPDESGEGQVRGASFFSTDEMPPVYFDFDKSNLRGDATEVLKRNSEVLLSNPEVEVLIEGHADSRGGSTYNLGLGQLRAKAIREYYMALGLDPAIIGTISYGEEMPVCEEEDEDCWARNRRGETKVR